MNGKAKPFSTREKFGIDFDSYKKWIEFQMTFDMTRDNIEIDHVTPICLFDVSKEEEKKEGFNWKNTQPLLREIHSQKRNKYSYLDYHLQYKKSYQFLLLNEEGPNQIIH